MLKDDTLLPLKDPKPKYLFPNYREYGGIKLEDKSSEGECYLDFDKMD